MLDVVDDDRVANGALAGVLLIGVGITALIRLVTVVIGLVTVVIGLITVVIGLITV